MFFKFVGNVPLIPLFEICKILVLEKVVTNQSGSLSYIDVFDTNSSSIPACDCSQAGYRGPIWQDVKAAFSSLTVGIHSGSTLIFKELLDKSILVKFLGQQSDLG